MFSYRRRYFYIFAICSAILLIALYLQYVDHLEPCLLCMVQRIFFFALALVALIACLHRHNRLSRLLYNSLSFILCLLGLLDAGRQIWLQHLPPNEKTSSFCVPGSEYFLHHASWSSLFQSIIAGTPECSVVAWRLFGLSMSEWSFLWLLILMILICSQFWWRQQSDH